MVVAGETVITCVFAPPGIQWYEVNPPLAVNVTLPDPAQNVVGPDGVMVGVITLTLL